MFKFLKNVPSLFRRRVAPTQRAGTSGTAVWGGYIQQKEDSADLTGTVRYDTFSNMLVNVAIVAAGVRYFLNLVAKAGWKIEAPEDSGSQGEEIKDILEDILFKRMETPWKRVVRRSSMYRFYGYSWQEWTAKVWPDGIIGYIDIEPRAQSTIERWDRDEAGKVLGVLQRSPQTMKELYIPRAKSVYVVDDSLNDSPEGLGLFRHMAESSRQLQKLEQLENWGYELDCRGMPIARAPLAEMNAKVKSGGMSSDARDAQEAVFKNFITNHAKSPQRGLMMDSVTYKTSDEKGQPSQVKKWELELAKAGSSGLGDLNNAIQRKTRDLARIMGVECILLGEAGAGSLAMARDKSEQFALVIDSTLAELAEVYNKDILRPLVRMNGWNEDLIPTLKPDSIQHRQVDEITEALANMAQAGALLSPDDPAVNAVRDLLGLPIQDDEGLLPMAIDASLDSETETEPEIPGDEE